MQYFVSYPGCAGRDANVIVTAVRDPLQTPRGDLSPLRARIRLNFETNRTEQLCAIFTAPLSCCCCRPQPAHHRGPPATTVCPARG
jgi:hypothetical protein